VRLFLLLLLVCACQRTNEFRYLNDVRYRRSTLESSLVSTNNQYSQLRLAQYGVRGRGWERLSEWNPKTAALCARDGAGEAPLTPCDAPQALGTADSADPRALVELGRVAFFRYPVQLLHRTTRPARELVARYGFWRDAAGRVGGLVEADLADGEKGVALTCATCHARVRGGAAHAGEPNGALDLGRYYADTLSLFSPPALAIAASWGAGRLDVSSPTATELARIPDLRPVRWLTYLQHDATVRQRDRIDLAIRIETLIITAHGQALRPPRIVALALASYLWSLADALTPAADPSALSGGRALFDEHCTRCHDGPGLTGPPVPLAHVMTDLALGRSPERGTGHYRVPSLRGVAGRPWLLHDASLAGLDEMFDARRVQPDFRSRRGQGAVLGHPFGLELRDEDRAELVSFLRTL
jgi:mono/diheme cytochrome c family protein